MRGTIPKSQLLFDPEIEKTARRNNSKTKDEKRLARLAQDGTSSSIPTTSGSITSGSTPRQYPQSSPPSSPRSAEEVNMAVLEQRVFHNYTT